MPHDHALLTIKEVAGLLRISLAAAYALVQDGALPSYRIGKRRGSIRVETADVTNYLSNCRTEGTPAKDCRPRLRLKHLRLP